MRTGFVLILFSLLMGFCNTAAAKPYPLEYFALREVTNNVTISPDGERVAMLKILSREGNPILHVYDADDMDADAFVVNSDPMEIFSYYWASDEHIVMTLRQRTRKMVKGQEDSVYDYRIAILNVKEETFEDFDAVRPVVENVLVNVPNKIIISEQPDADNPFKLDDAYRPRAYYEMDLKRGTKKLLMRGKWSVAQVAFDADGHPRVARGFDVDDGEYIMWYRDPGEKEWRDVWRADENNFEIWMEDAVGFDPAVPGNVLLKAFNGDDKMGLWSYNTKSEQFDELLYRRSDVDVYGVRMHSNTWKYPQTVTAVSYFKDNFHFEYFDEIEGATFRQLEELIPNSHYVSITSRSRDGASLVAMNQGPRDPGTYYLLHNGEFKEVGSRQPLFDGEELADVEFFEYKARDGKKLTSFMTIPKGEPPYPTVVMPHGGPHVREIVLYDEWAQMLANNGYLVVQPQFRMSHGYGFDHFTSAFLNGSEAGRMMQDDKDDAVLHLVEEGIADPDRLAMYGWSYGGYAALIAASRTPQIYQCTIAGAAVTDYRQAAIDGFRGGSPRGTGKVWDEVYERGAVQPVKEVPKVNVPILLIHGDVDSRVLPKQARLYLDELEEHDKYHKMVWLEGADHFYVTLFYEHQLMLYESLIDFLHNDCGMATDQTEMQVMAAADDD
ncbi:MAG: prolyl oligopeptidase family serine peptidase [Woeseiaceae bacterium]|nr:prolyl oligopeptidase family serine peptidase [Woeseiaceae bacterium]